MKTLAPVTSRIQLITRPLRRGLFPDALCSRAAILGRGFAIVVVFFCVRLLLQSCGATPFQWEYTGSLNEARENLTATLLPDGKVLVAGGFGSIGQLGSAEIYDPITGLWSITGSLETARSECTATLLGNGSVLVAGGYGASGALKSAELYDPVTETWASTGSLGNGRYLHTATLLHDRDRSVLVAGGVGPDGGVSAELYHPPSGSWLCCFNLNTARFYHTATLLPDGRVLIAGGVNGNTSLSSAELFDPATGTWTYTGNLHVARERHTATLLLDGRVLVAGGADPSYLTSSELYDPTTGVWTVTGSLNDARTDHTATLLPSGQVLVAGGYGAFTSAELYDSATGTWTFTGSLNAVRTHHTATLLPTGEVLAAGGVGPLSSTELYDPGIETATKVYGSGTVNNQGNEVTFRFRASQTVEGSKLGPFEFCDPAGGVCIAKAGIYDLSITGTTAADFSGSGHLEDGTKVRFKGSVTNNSKPGTSDTISITLDNGYSISGTLTSGDIKIY